MNYGGFFSLVGIFAFLVGLLGLAQSIFAWSLDLQRSFWILVFAVVLILTGGLLANMDRKSRSPKE